MIPPSLLLNPTRPPIFLFDSTPPPTPLTLLTLVTPSILVKKTLDPKPSTLNPKSVTLNPKISILNPTL
jgi:hypothetical protein